MLEEPRCRIRKCKHYRGVIQPDGTEGSETNSCAAFPRGIPNEISYGTNLHSKPLPGQRNKIVYERGR